MKASLGRLAIRMLSDSRKVIPLVFRNGEIWHTDIRLPHLVVTNESGSEARTIGVSTDAIVADEVVATFRATEAAIAEAVAEANALLNKLVSKKAGVWRTYNLRMLFASEPSPEETLAETHRLAPGSKVCLPLSELFAFDYAGWDRIDRVVCRLHAIVEGTEEVISFEIPLTAYTCKGDYAFPVHGPVAIESTAWNRELGHRDAASQEFAFDVIDVRRLEDGQLALSSPAGSSDVSDYFAFDREILAIGDGVVAECGNEWPDAFAENPLEYSVDRVTDMTVKLLEDGMPFNHAILGNYVVIDHRNGEYSLYAHMREGSVLPKVGEEVGQGQVIGRIGNTSNSEGPHLHFHLMDGPDFRFANGLPVRFRDLPKVFVPGTEYPERNPLLYSDYIFTYVGD